MDTVHTEYTDIKKSTFEYNIDVQKTIKMYNLCAV